MAMNEGLADTGSGLRRSEIAPFPSCPDALSPQQYARPPRSNPQVKFHPVVIAVHVWLLATRGRAERPGDAASPPPTWPCTFDPQHHASPSASRPHECAAPTAIAMKLCPSAARTAGGLGAIVLSPSCPWSLSPQHHAAPPPVPRARAQLCDIPAAIVPNR